MEGCLKPYCDFSTKLPLCQIFFFISPVAVIPRELFKNIIHFLAVLGLGCCMVFSCSEQRLLSSWGVQFPHCDDSSRCRALVLGHAGFRSCGAWVPLLHGTWDPLRLGTEPMSPALEADSLLLSHYGGPQENSWITIHHAKSLGFPGCPASKESTCNAGDPGSIPGSGRSAGEEIGYPLQYSLASLVAQLIKNLPIQHGLDPWVRKISWRRGRLPTLVFWPGEFHGLYSP